MFENVYNVISPSNQELSSSAETVPAAIKLFEGKGFKVRVIMRNGEPWFVAKDACTCLEIVNVSDACSRLDEDERGIVLTDTPSGKQEMLIVSEPGLYSLIGSSKKPEAKAFKRWVNHEVLPSIRKTGKYEVKPMTIYDYARALLAEKERSDALEAQNKALEAERDEAVRTKAMIGSRREATAMATAAAKSRECKKLAAENEELTAENEGLKDAVGRGSNWRTVSMMTSEWIRDFGHAPSYHKLKKFSLDLERDEMPVKDVEEKVILKNGSEKVNVVNRYHRKAWELYREYEETIRAVAV